MGSVVSRAVAFFESTKEERVGDTVMTKERLEALRAWIRSEIDLAIRENAVGLDFFGERVLIERKRSSTDTLFESVCALLTRDEKQL